jgi:hypothetical protein
MEATVVKLPVRVRLTCSKCGAGGEASCDCGVPYVPAGDRAAAAIAANPTKSNRAIADDLGVSEPTVRRARNATASHDAVGKRTGKDGKARKMPVRRIAKVQDVHVVSIPARGDDAAA